MPNLPGTQGPPRGRMQGERTMAEKSGQVAGKVALVTGGASGIGEACVLTLAREGASVVITDIDASRGKALAEKIVADGGKAIFLQQDVTSEARWPEVIEAAEKGFGGLHILVANAGIGIMVRSSRCRSRTGSARTPSISTASFSR